MSLLVWGLGRGLGDLGEGDEVGPSQFFTCFHPYSYLHAKNIIHRDLKSNSIYLSLSKGWGGVRDLKGCLLMGDFWGQSGRGTCHLALVRWQSCGWCRAYNRVSWSGSQSCGLFRCCSWALWSQSKVWQLWKALKIVPDQGHGHGGYGCP